MSCEDYYEEGEWNMSKGLDEFIKNTSKEKRIIAAIKMPFEWLKKIFGGK